MYKSFQDLPVRENAITLAEDIFLLTRHLPRSEDYGLTSQMRRAAIANIAKNPPKRVFCFSSLIRKIRN